MCYLASSFIQHDLKYRVWIHTLPTEDHTLVWNVKGLVGTLILSSIALYFSMHHTWHALNTVVSSLEYLCEVFAGGAAQARDHALQTADTLGGRGHGRHQQLLLLQVAPPRQRGRGCQGACLRTHKDETLMSQLSDMHWRICEVTGDKGNATATFSKHSCCKIAV